MLKKMFFILTGMLFLLFAASPGFSSYHHMGEKDSAEFLKVYPDKKDTKLDSCALCHSGGQYKSSSGAVISMGSCQWCHYKYGYDGKGNIKDTLNPYGNDYLTNGRNPGSISTIASKDSDGDGYKNEDEIKATRFPGIKEDDPTKKTAPFRVYTISQLESLPQHTQFLLMNASKSEDYYAEYKGVALETLLKDAGILSSATGIRIYSPDGWSQYHPLNADPDPSMYHVFGDYPAATYQYDIHADKANGGWCNYSSPLCKDHSAKSLITNAGGLKLLLAYKRDGKDLTPGALTLANKLDGEGPFRAIVPQKTPSPPDQGSTAADQNVVWPYKADWDHNAGVSTRTATIIKVEPLPEGTTDIDIMEAGWQYVDQKKIVIYGAIKESSQ
jgi:hypothetical protein